VSDQEDEGGHPQFQAPETVDGRWSRINEMYSFLICGQRKTSIRR
jgi:hypothetical protein